MNIDKKICRTCKEEKGIEEYYPRQLKSGIKYDCDCKICRKEKVNKFREENKDRVNKEQRQKYYDNHEESKEKMREYYHKNIDKMHENSKKRRESPENKKKKAQQDKIYREKNEKKIKSRRTEKHKQIKEKECRDCGKIGDYTLFNRGYTVCKKCQAKQYKDYRKENKDKISEKKRVYERRKRETDPKYKLDKNISRSINSSLKNGKGGKHWEDLVGYTLNDLYGHLEKLFKDGMNWENQGKYWEIDHIIPKSWFKYKTYEDEEFKLCWSLPNLQPLRTEINRKKNNKFIG